MKSLSIILYQLIWIVLNALKLTVPKLLFKMRSIISYAVINNLWKQKEEKSKEKHKQKSFRYGKEFNFNPLSVFTNLFLIGYSICICAIIHVESYIICGLHSQSKRERGRKNENVCMKFGKYSCGRLLNHCCAFKR